MAILARISKYVRPNALAHWSPMVTLVRGDGGCLTSVTVLGTLKPIMGTHASMDGVAQLLFGSVRREVLALLLSHPDERFYFRELLRAVGGGSGAVQRE